jgi:hypothetical protein
MKVSDIKLKQESAWGSDWWKTNPKMSKEEPAALENYNPSPYPLPLEREGGNLERGASLLLDTYPETSGRG